MKRLLTWLLLVAVVAGMVWLFPLFHVVRIEIPSGRHRPAAVQAPAFARKFWTETLLPATDRAVPIGELLEALARDADHARKRFGRSPGIASATYFFVRGAGKISAIEKESLNMTVDGSSSRPQIELFTGFLFGNAVRDATGLLSASDFPNSQDFNDLSTELNRIVETDILPPLRSRAAIGKTLRFAGCLELEEAPVPGRLQIIPVKAEWGP